MNHNETISHAKSLDFFWLRQELKKLQSVGSIITSLSLSRAFNRHLSGLGLSNESIRPLSGHPLISLSFFCHTDGALNSLSCFQQLLMV